MLNLPCLNSRLLPPYLRLNRRSLLPRILILDTTNFLQVHGQRMNQNIMPNFLQSGKMNTMRMFAPSKKVLFGGSRAYKMLPWKKSMR